MEEKVLLPWGIDYCKCEKIKTSHTPLCVDCIKLYVRVEKIKKIKKGQN